MKETGGAATNAEGAPEEYSAAVDAAELLSVRLIQSEFSVEAEAYQRDKSGWKRSYGCEPQGVAFNSKRDRLSGSVAAEVVCRAGRKRIVVAKCRYLVDYAIKGSPTDAAAQTFFSRVGVFAAYPYFRSHFAELTSQAGLLLGPLPVLKESARPMPKEQSSHGPAGTE